MGSEILLAAYILSCASYLDEDPLRCFPHPRKDAVEFAGFVLFPTIFVRLLIFGLNKKRNTRQTRSFFGYLNIWQSIAYMIWTIYGICEILNHPKLVDCKYNNHSMLEINFVLLIFFGLFPTVILTCFVLYCIGLMPFACYKICS